MYQRFLKNADYLGLITEDGLEQLTRGDETKIAKAEMSAEMSIVEYLTQNFEIEKVLSEGRSITEYNRQITYPVGSYFLLNNEFYKVIKSISGILRPSTTIYWIEREDIYETKEMPKYSQKMTYQPKDLVVYNEIAYECVEGNGVEFNNIQIPGLVGWQEIETYEWQQVPYNLWEVVRYNDKFYTLLSEEGYDYLATPFESDNWGMIGDYDEALDNYELSEHEYVVAEGKVFYPVINVNPDIPKVGVNIYPEDPRNQNVKKHMLQLALYELHKLISPNNISTVRITDHDDSIQWLRDASRLKLNPGIPRKIDEDYGKPVLDWQVATFQREYNPNENPWQV